MKLIHSPGAILYMSSVTIQRGSSRTLGPFTCIHGLGQLLLLLLLANQASHRGFENRLDF
jgi:hypothetical protein